MGATCNSCSRDSNQNPSRIREKRIETLRPFTPVIAQREKTLKDFLRNPLNKEQKKCSLPAIKTLGTRRTSAPLIPNDVNTDKPTVAVIQKINEDSGGQEKGVILNFQQNQGNTNNIFGPSPVVQNEDNNKEDQKTEEIKDEKSVSILPPIQHETPEFAMHSKGKNSKLPPRDQPFPFHKYFSMINEKKKPKVYAPAPRKISITKEEDMSKAVTTSTLQPSKYLEVKTEASALSGNNQTLVNVMGKSSHSAAHLYADSRNQASTFDNTKTDMPSQNTVMETLTIDTKINHRRISCVNVSHEESKVKKVVCKNLLRKPQTNIPEEKPAANPNTNEEVSNAYMAPYRRYFTQFNNFLIEIPR